MAALYTGERLYGDFDCSAPLPHLAKIAKGLKEYRRFLKYQQDRSMKASQNLRWALQFSAAAKSAQTTEASAMTV